MHPPEPLECQRQRSAMSNKARIFDAGSQGRKNFFQRVVFVTLREMDPIWFNQEKLS